MRVRRKAWAEEEVVLNPHVVKEPEALKGKWQERFKNSNPIYVEIGCGKGTFVYQNALTFGNINFIGIERQSTVIGIAAKKIEPDMNNIALIHGDVENIMDIFEHGEIERLYINFCDPWPKKKHAKRRLTYSEFIKRYTLLLNSSGEIHFKTDNEGLFDFSVEEFQNCGWKLKNVTRDLHKSGFEGNIMTEYEKKFSDRGMPIYRLEAVKP